MVDINPPHDGAPRWGLILVFDEQVHLEVAHDALWTHSSLDGPLSFQSDRFGQPTSSDASVKDGGAWGKANINGEIVGCRAVCELWPDTPAKVINLWLHADDAEVLGTEADEWLADIARHVWPALPFDFGIV